MDYCTNAELTQCAHRNRPLRFDGRVVVTLCEGTVDYLPITETVLAFPALEEDGSPSADAKRDRDLAQLDAAWDCLMERGEQVTVRRLQAEAHVATETARGCLQVRRWEGEGVASEAG